VENKATARSADESAKMVQARHLHDEHVPMEVEKVFLDHEISANQSKAPPGHPSMLHTTSEPPATQLFAERADLMDRDLLKLAHEVEQAAFGLRVFRDSLPYSAGRITAIIGQLYSISSLLQTYGIAQADPRYSPHSPRLEMALLCSSLRFTIHDIFLVFDKSRYSARRSCWEDLNRSVLEEGGFDLVTRVDLYEALLTGYCDILRGRAPRNLSELKRDLQTIYDAQILKTPSQTSTPLQPSESITTRSSSPLQLTGSTKAPVYLEKPIDFQETESVGSQLVQKDSADEDRNPIHWISNVYDGAEITVTPFRREYRR
jgi:hypothetical protein